MLAIAWRVREGGICQSMQVESSVHGGGVGQDGHASTWEPIAKKGQHSVMEPPAKKKTEKESVAGSGAKKVPSATWDGMGWWGHAVAYRN